ncbi:MAG: hypothetical protein JWQ63_4207 [Mucilaginibacter sp.]|nr:hypothetical protein [Mucilaginibacter sp.]
MEITRHLTKISQRRFLIDNSDRKEVLKTAGNKVWQWLLVLNEPP